MKYCVAVSGGCDSMTLLDQCIKKGLDIIVAHVNYQKRESAKRDELLVRDYCEKHHVPFFVKYCPTVYKGNFQGYARKFRYDFFRDLCKQEKCDSFLVAHQQDDLFETYLIQFHIHLHACVYIHTYKQRKTLLIHSNLLLVLRFFLNR